MPAKNEFYTFPDQKLSESYKTAIKSISSEEFSYLYSEYRIKTAIIEKKEVKNQMFLSEEHIKDLLHEPTELEYEEYEDLKLKDDNFYHEKELLEQYEENQIKEEKFEDIDEFLKEKIDQDYERYKFLLELNKNKEIMRYSRGKDTFPMWYSEENQWKTTDVGKCVKCGGNRVFELQVNSTFLNLFKELMEFDWGIIAIYTFFHFFSFFSFINVFLKAVKKAAN